MKEKVGKYFLIFIIVSFIGWLWETCYLYIMDGKFYDRGFLTLPLCPIYGTVILSIYFVMGTPTLGRGILSNVTPALPRCLMYVALSFVFATVGELIVGVVFSDVLGISLWSYEGMAFNTGGHIALGISVVWSAAIFLFMLFAFPRIKKLVFSIPERASNFVSLLLLIAVTLDFIRCIEKI